MNYKKLVENVIIIAREAGAFISKESASFDMRNVEYKGFNDLVSYVDKTSEEILVNRLQDLLPDAGFITEEGTVSRKDEEYNWVIDPLDGTTNFVHGLPIFAVSIALIRDKLPVLGVVYEVNTDECFYAIENGGAFCDMEPIKVSQTPRLEESLIATGFPYHDFDQADTYLGILREFMQRTHGIRRMGSAAVDMVYVACGRFEGFYEYNLNPWDIAAGALIVKEAGGKVGDFIGGDDYLFRREILAAGAIYDQMFDVIRSRWK